jgi:hypothetical protein
MQGVADELMPRFIGNRQAIFLLQPLPNRLVTGKTLGLGEAHAEGLLYGF